MQQFELHTNVSFKVAGYALIYIYNTVQQKIIFQFRYTILRYCTAVRQQNAINAKPRLTKTRTDSTARKRKA